MIESTWLQFQYHVLTAFVLLSLFCNGILMILIQLKSPKQLGTYKYLMNFISIFEICYSIVDYIVVPVMHSYGSSFFIMTPLTHTFLNKQNALIMQAVWCGFFGSSMAIFGIHFIYRYLAVSGNSYISTFNGPTLILWMLMPIINGFIWGTVALICCGPKDVLTNYIRNNLMETFGLSVDEVVYIGPYFFDENGKFLLDWDVLITLFGASLIMGSSLCTIFYFGWKCYKALSDLQSLSSGYSPQYRALQRQFFAALVCQTVIPISLMHFPLLISYSGALLNRGFGRLSNLASITIAFYPAIDPLPSILIIKNYREGVKNFCLAPIQCCIKLKKKYSSKVANVEVSDRRSSSIPENGVTSVWGEVL